MAPCAPHDRWIGARAGRVELIERAGNGDDARAQGNEIDRRNVRFDVRVGIEGKDCGRSPETPQS